MRFYKKISNANIAALVVILITITGCKTTENSPSEKENQATIEQQLETTKVKIAKVRRDKFELELVSNGKVSAGKKAILPFKVNGIVRSVLVKNGERVTAGEKLITIDDREALSDLREAKLSLEQKELDLKSRLMSEGIIDLSDTTNPELIPPHRLQAIKIQTGYLNAELAYEKAKYTYNNIVISAPFAGIIADLEAKPYNLSTNYLNACTVIDDSNMEVVFNILETDVRNIKIGMKVIITPYADDRSELIGKVSEVNPKIDKNGMVKIKAITENSQGLLVDGMNVSILVKRDVADKLIIPKSAVLPRQGKKVVFVYQDGKAIWKYVSTGEENSTEISIEDGLSEGEDVIYFNNLGLSHENSVTVIE